MGEVGFTELWSLRCFLLWNMAGGANRRHWSTGW